MNSAAVSTTPAPPSTFAEVQALVAPEMRRVDSLYYRAMTADPLFYRRYDALLFRTYLQEAFMAASRRARGAAAEADRSETTYWIDVWLRGAGPSMRAWQAYSDGRYKAAYDKALGKVQPTMPTPPPVNRY